VSKLLILPFIFQAKFIKFFLKVIKKGNATSLPGLLVELYFPSIVLGLSTGYKQVIVVSGTNGKTTTRSILTNIFKRAGYKVCTNLGGANIYRGIASSLLLDKTLAGKTKSDILILEIEEATLPKISPYLKVDKLILTNLFRDQLDLYGEIDKTLYYFQQTLKILDKPNLEVIINADDGKLTSLINYKITENLKFKITGFSLNLPADVKPKFEQEAIWPANYLNSLWKIKPIFKLIPDHNSLEDNQSYFKIEKSSNNKFTDVSFVTNLEGSYNLYNCISAIIASQEIDVDIIKNSLTVQTKVFGRGEEIIAENVKFKIILVKNPASFNLVLDSISSKNKSANLIFLVNDKIADGKDVSWLWDINFEKFFVLSSKNKHTILTGGTRGLDMLLRLEYAGQQVNLKNNYSNLQNLIENILNQNNNSTIKEYTVLATYTAMTEFREILATKVNLKKINDESF
jgi:lipid II isoglutaminyl synthase (glutamine-hydrolysing)